MRYIHIQCLIICWLFASGLAALGQEPAAESSDESAAIQSAIQSYVAAFNAKDVAKLVNLWSPDGVYMSRTSGEETVGREALEAVFKETFEDETVPKLSVDTKSIDFVSPNVALERGTATITRSTDGNVESDYSVVYVKQDGAWLIDRVTEEEIVVEQTHFDQLKVLGWLIGDWLAEDEGFRLEMSFKWTAKQNFISCQYKVVENGVESSGLQVIGWDAKEKNIRSWLFDSDGGVVTGTWNKRDDGWSVTSVATLAEGESGSFTSLFRLKDDASFGWEKINQVVDGNLLPNIDEIVVQRQ